MDSNFAELLTTAGLNTPTHILEGRLILSVLKVLFTGCTPSLHPHCTHKVENAKGKGCTCTRRTRGSGIPVCIPTLISLGIKVSLVGIPTTLEAKGCNIQNMSRRKVIYLCLYFPVLSIYVFTVIKCCSKCV